MERLHILDGHGYIFRAHYALMGGFDRRGVRLSTSAGMPTGALYVFTRMAIRLWKDWKPQRMAVVFDAPGPSFRRAIDTQYKANRSAPPDELLPQMPIFRQITEALAWPTIEVPGVEADDVIATMVDRARAAGWEVVIFSADKDMMQLVGSGVQVIDSMRQLTYTREEVEKKFGVPPEQIADFLALCGDTSDNIPGVAGIGKVSAAKLLATYGSIDGILAGAPEMKGKLKEKFTDPVQVARLGLSRRLVELKRDVDLGVELEALRATGWNIGRLRDLFVELEFNALLPELQNGGEEATSLAADEAGGREGAGAESGAAGPGGAATGAGAAATAAMNQAQPPEAGEPAATPAPEPEVPAVLLLDVDAVRALAAAARAAGRVAVQVEADEMRPGPASDRAFLVGMALAVPGQAPAYLPLGHRYLGCPPQLQAAQLPSELSDMLADPAVAKVVHDAKSARRLLRGVGLALDGVVEDTLLAQFLLDASRNAYLEDRVLASSAGVVMQERKMLLGKQRAVAFDAAPVPEVAAWSGRAAAAVLRAGDELGRRLKKAGLWELQHGVEIPVSRILSEIEDIGVTVNVAYLAELSAEIAQPIAELEQRARELVGDPELNLGSPKQVGTILFDRLGLKSDRMKKTQTGYSTDHEVLESLVDDHPVVRILLEHRELVKIKGTYLDALPPLVNRRTGRLHTTFNQATAATGRISAQDPNLQHIPIRSRKHTQSEDIGLRIRRAFIPGPGLVMVAADYSQIELRILAHLSGDPVLSAAFRERIDVHTQTAAEVFGIGREAVGPEERRVAKAVNYGLVYGQSDFGLARALDIPRKQAREYIDRYFEHFPTIRKFMQEVVAKARTAGGARTLLGRWRPIPDLRSKSPMARQAAERVAQNTPMQGSGADILKLAMIKVRDRIEREQLGAAMLLTVHDELVLEVAPEKADALAAAVKEEMEQAYALAVPIEVDVGVGSSWAET